eukprot:3607000-Pyramimonas_sp.AAC.1
MSPSTGSPNVWSNEGTATWRGHVAGVSVHVAREDTWHSEVRATLLGQEISSGSLSTFVAFGSLRPTIQYR